MENEKDFCNECNPNDGCNYCTTKIDNNTLIVEFEEKYDDSDYTDTIKMYEKKLNYTCVEH